MSREVAARCAQAGPFEHVRERADRRSRAFAADRTAQVVTFDDHGVSGHANHRACAAGVRAWHRGLGPQRPAAPRLWALRSLPVALKFAGPLGALALLCAGPLACPGGRCLASPTPGALRAAMAAHASQLVWFRRVYTFASVYMYAVLLERRHGA